MVILYIFFVTQIPENGLSNLTERLLLFRHDYKSSNILQLVNSASDVVDETLIEIVLTSSRKFIFFSFNPLRMAPIFNFALLNALLSTQ